MVRNEFRKNAVLTDAVQIENAKAGAVRALSNYLLATAGMNDPKVKGAMKDFNDRSVPSTSAQEDSTKPETK